MSEGGVDLKLTTTHNFTKMFTAPNSKQPVRVNYIFVDYENVQEFDLGRIANKPVRVILVLGERHKKLPLILVKDLLRCADQVELVETRRTGKNALDLVLAEHIGEKRKADPHGYFHILSRDKDFDALIEHLKANDALAARRASFSEIPVLMDKDERVKWIAGKFTKDLSTRPKRKAKLESQIQVQFGRALSLEELEETIQGLIAGKVIELTAKGEVLYRV